MKDTMKAILFTVTFGLFLCISATNIEHETILDYGCTAQTAIVFKELRWRELLYINSTSFWFEVDNIEPGDSSIQCPGPCDALKNTLYKVDLHPRNTESNEIEISFAPHEEEEEEKEVESMMKKDPILCTCDMMSRLVFQGSCTLITCTEKSEVKNVRNSWKSKLPRPNHTLNTIWVVCVTISTVVIVLFLFTAFYAWKKQGTPKDQQPSEGRGLAKIFKKNVLSNIYVCRLYQQENDDEEELCKA